MGEAQSPSVMPMPWGDPVTYCAALCSVARHDAVFQRRDQAVEELRQIAESARRIAESIRPPRVLIVEEDHDSARCLADRFEEQLGAEVVLVHDGAEAMTLLSHDSRWSLVVLDLRLPNRNGLELARAIERHIPLAIFSAYWTDGASAAADVLGVRWKRHKPVEYPDLVNFVREVAEAIALSQ